MKSIKRYVYLAIAMLAFLFAGVIYAWSTIKLPLATEVGYEGVALQFNYTLTLIFFCLGGLVSGLLSKKISFTVRMIISAVLLAAGFIIVSTLSEGSSIGLLYLAYGVMAGTAIGITYNSLIAVTGAWFPDKKGICSGCLMMAFGFSALVIGKVASACFAVEAVGWRMTYMILGIAVGVVLLIAGFVIRFPKENEVPKVEKKNSADSKDYTPKEMLKTVNFYKLFIFFFLLSSVGSTAIGSAREVLLSISEDAAAMTATIVGVISVCNGIGRLISGTCFDMLGLRKTQIITSIIAILAPAVVFVSIITKIAALAVVGLCLCGISYGFSPTVTVAFANVFYGQKNFAVNLPILNLVLIPAAFMTTLSAALGGMNIVFIVLICFSIVGFAINLSIRNQ